MLVQLKTNLQDDAKTLQDIKEIIKYAKLNFDINLYIEKYSDKTSLQLAVLNNVVLQKILEEIE